MKPAYLWLDTETTGFDVPNVALLEVGAAIVDHKFEVISTFERVVHFNPDKWRGKPIELTVQQLHTESGLWEACATSKHTAEDVDHALRVWAKAFPCGEIPLAGYSVWFDRRVAEVHLPEFAKCLSGRQFETRTLETLNRRLGFPRLERAAHPHRALKDVLGDLTDVRAYVARLETDWPEAV